MNETGRRAYQKQILLREEFVKAFYRLIRTVRIHRENNRMLIGSAENFVQATEDLGIGAEPLTLYGARGRLWLQGEKLIYRAETVGLFDEMYDYFQRRSIRGIRLGRPVRNAAFRHILTFARLLNRARQQSAPGEWLRQELSAAELTWAEVISKENSDTSAHRRERAKKIYSRVLYSVQEVVRKLTCHKQAGIGKTLRLAQNMVDLMMEDPPLFMALSTMRIYDDYTFCHSVNVAILSMCLGRRLNLSKRSLERLGLCGLLHDLGKTEVPKAILNKPGKLTDAEFEVMKRHSLNSVRLIVKIEASRDRKAKLLLPPFEHHLKYDLSGYPQTHRREPLTLFGRILAIADVYDAITSPRVYRRSVLSPDQALGMMFGSAGRDFDPILLKVFINILGVYPVGTLLELEGGEIGLSIGDCDVHDPGRPRVILLTPDGKGGYQKGVTADLAEADPATGTYRRNIVRGLHPSAYGIQAAEFLV